MPKLCVIPGDGIGKEVIPAAVTVLREVLPDLKTVEAEAGWECFEKNGVSVPEATLSLIRENGAALFGAVSSPSYKVEGYRSAILTLRQTLGLFANIRPIRSLPSVSPRMDVDMIIVRENSEGLYSGREQSDGETAIAERVITRAASEKIGRAALDICRELKRKKLTIVHKANVLPLTDGLFRDTIRKVSDEYALDNLGIQIDELLVDIAALKMLSEPQRYDLIVTTNLFGDILSDAAAYWCGGMGLAPSINLGEGIAIAEPVHGSAPDIAGKGVANPIAAILSVSLLAQYYWKMPEASNRINQAVYQFLENTSNNPVDQMGTRNIVEQIINNLS